MQKRAGSEFKMSKLLVALLLAPAAAYVIPCVKRAARAGHHTTPQVAPARASAKTSLAGAKEDLMALQDSIPGPPGETQCGSPRRFDF